MDWLTTIGKAITAIFSAIGKWFEFKERRDHIQAGEDKADLEQHKRADEAEKRKDSVPVPDKQSTSDSMRDGTF